MESTAGVDVGWYGHKYRRISEDVDTTHTAHEKNDQKLFLCSLHPYTCPNCSVPIPTTPTPTVPYPETLLPPSHSRAPSPLCRRILEAQEAEEREREERKERKKEQKRKEREAEEAAAADDADPEMMAMMGFGGFGGGK